MCLALISTAGLVYADLTLTSQPIAVWFDMIVLGGANTCPAQSGVTCQAAVTVSDELHSKVCFIDI